MKTRTPATVKIVQPRRGPNEQPWEPFFQALCSEGHEVHAEVVVETCPFWPKGQPCPGTLTRFGKGARS